MTTLAEEDEEILERAKADPVWAAHVREVLERWRARVRRDGVQREAIGEE